MTPLDLSKPGASLTITLGVQDLPFTITQTGRKSPQLPRKNDYFRPVSGGKGTRARIILTDVAKRHRIKFTAACNAAGLFCSKARPLITFGLWTMTVMVWAGRKRGELIDGWSVPLIDADACVSPVADLLMHAGVIDDDHRIDSVHAGRSHRSALPGYSVSLERRPSFAEWGEAEALGVKKG